MSFYLCPTCLFICVSRVIIFVSHVSLYLCLTCLLILTLHSIKLVRRVVWNKSMHSTKWGAVQLEIITWTRKVGQPPVGKFSRTCGGLEIPKRHITSGCGELPRCWPGGSGHPCRPRSALGCQEPDWEIDSDSTYLTFCNVDRGGRSEWADALSTWCLRPLATEESWTSFFF